MFLPKKTRSIGQGGPIQGGQVFKQRVVFFRMVDPSDDSKALVPLQRPEPSGVFMTAETDAEKATGGEDCEVARPGCGPPGDLDELQVSPIRMWVAAEDPEPVERQEPDIFRGAVLRRCDEREEGLDVVGGELGDVVLGRWRRTRESEVEGCWSEAEFSCLPGDGIAHFHQCLRVGVPDGFSFRPPTGDPVTGNRW